MARTYKQDTNQNLDFLFNLINNEVKDYAIFKKNDEIKNKIIYFFVNNPFFTKSELLNISNDEILFDKIIEGFIINEIVYPIQVDETTLYVNHIVVEHYKRHNIEIDSKIRHFIKSKSIYNF